MELDVHLKREGEESWGFRLIGGKEFRMPLTVVKVVPGSPAATAGLQNGDAVRRINAADASDMTHDDAKRYVADASDLTIGVKRGLYDPVLDDYEPIYEPIDQEDFDQPSQPTEVDPFKIQQFLDPSQSPGALQDPQFTPGGLPELRDIETPQLNGYALNGNGYDQSRSLTASPFVLPTKPYRPFSTEPLPDILVPPLETPIILNPKYKDNFGKLGDSSDGGLPPTRFKLPISEQYDPDGTKKKKKEGSVVKEVKFAGENLVKTKDVSSVENDSMKIQKDVTVCEVDTTEQTKQKAVEEKMFMEKIKKEIDLKMFMEKMKKEIDLDKIEMTAVSIVDESIERAVSVTDEIKKQIDMELMVSSKSDETTCKETSRSEVTTDSISTISIDKTSKEASELVQLIDKTTDEIITYNGQKVEVSVAKEVQKFESHDIKDQVVDERRLSTKQEIEETIEVGSVRRKSEVFDKKNDTKSAELEKVEKKSTEKIEKDAAKETQEVKKEKMKLEEVKVAQEVVQKNVSKAETVNGTKHTASEIRKQSASSQKSSMKTSTTTNMSKLQSDHTKAYLIGLQTIPNLKGTITPYHYHMLLKTFFIHLTDVMVALSRFILTEPAFSKTDENQNIVRDEVVSRREDVYKEEEQVINKKQEAVERKQSAVKEMTAMESEKEEKAVETKEEVKQTEKVFVAEAKIMDRKETKVQAQLVARKIEHQDVMKTIAQEIVVDAIDEKRYREDTQENLEVEQIMERKEKLSGAQMAQIQERKSAELTQIMDAVITEFQNKAGIEEAETTIERRSKSRSKVKEEEIEQKEITEIKSEAKSFSSVTESTEKKHVETIETQDESSSSEEGKQMYVAIVESHVFTNKDAIFEEKAVSFTETSSVVSAEETNVAMQTSETIATEQVTLESKDIKKEIAETVLEESRELNIVNAQAQEIVHKAEELETTAIVEESKAIIEEVKEEKATEVDTKVVQEVVIQEVIEPMVEVQETKSVEISEDYQKITLKEEESIMTVSEKTEVHLAETHETIAIAEVKQEVAAVSVEELTAVEVIKDEKLETVSTEEVTQEINKAVAIEEIKTVEVAEEKITVVKEEPKSVELVKQEIKRVEYVPPPIQQVNVEFKVVQRARSKTPVYEEASAALTIVKPAKTPTEEAQELIFSQQADVSMSKSSEIVGSGSELASTLKSKMESYKTTEIEESSFTAILSDSSKSNETQESSFTAKLSNSAESKVLKDESTTKEKSVTFKADKTMLKLDLGGGIKKDSSDLSIASTIATPTPSTVPPTPLTDEYVFKLKARMPKEVDNPIPRDCTPTPEDEDPNIVKKKLIAYIDATIESPIIYDPPLPSPPLDKVQSPVYSKPGLKGGYERQHLRKEEILEIERTSSLLASAIDETIKSIEEYKEEVGIDTKKETNVEKTTKFEKTGSKTVGEHTFTKSEVTVSSSETKPIIYNGFAKVETKVYNTIGNNHIEEEWNKIDEQVKQSNEELSELSNNVDIEVDVTLKVKDETTSNGIAHSPEAKRKLVETIEITAEIDKDNKVSIESVDVKTEIDKTNTGHIEFDIHKGNNEISNDISAEFTIKTECPIVKPKAMMEEITTKTEIEQKQRITEEISRKVETVTMTNGYHDSQMTNGDNEVTFTAKNKALTNGNDTTPMSNGIHEEPPMAGNMNGICENGVDMPMTNGVVPKVVIEKPPPMFAVAEKKDPLAGYRPIQFDPEEIKATKRGLQSIHVSVQPQTQRAQTPSYVDNKGAPLGTHQGIVDSLEEAVVNEEIAKELGKPGLTEQKIAELISGESEMLREAHVMGLSRVLKSHMHRADDDSSVDFKKIKPILQSLKDSEVLKALNEEIERAREEKRKEEEKKWTTFMQKPKRPVPKSKFGYPGWVQEEEKVEEPYKVKIVKQPKPKVAPDYKPKDFETGPLPWEERALNEPPPPPVEPEEPILIPEEVPEFLEAVDPLPESEVPDLEDTGIPLPSPPPVEEESTPSPVLEEVEEEEEPAEELDLEAVVEDTERIVVEMEQNKLAEQLLMGVQSMVDPNASVEQQLAQMRAQMAALAQLPSVIQHTLDIVTKQLSQLTHTETPTESQYHAEMQPETQECTEVAQNQCEVIEEEPAEEQQTNEVETENTKMTIEEVVEETKPSLTQEELEKLRREEEEMLEEQRRIEKQKKEMMDQMKIEQESRQVKQRATPRVGKPKQVFGSPTPVARPLVLPGGRRWRKPEDAYNEAFFAETLSAQAELIQGKTKGCSFESDILPYDERINFMKYEKPPVSLDHLQHSETYKLIHNMEQTPVKRVEMLTPVIAESDYREKCRSVTPTGMIPQQVHR